MVEEEKTLEKKYPLVTICIPSYNHSAYIQDCIRSVIQQDYEYIELIIIDDGSKDGSLEKIYALKAECIKRFKRFEIRSRENKGLCATLNEGLEWANGFYFSPIASDDILLSHKTSYLVKKQKETNAVVVFGSVERIDENNNSLGVIIRKGEHCFEDMFLLKEMPLAPASLMIRNVIKEIGGFAEDVKLEDLYMWLCLTNDGKKLISYPEIVAQYRDHESNTVKDKLGMYTSRLEVLNLFSSKGDLYRKAIKENSLLAANALATKQFYLPLKMLIEGFEFSLRVLLILLKIFTPKFLIIYLKNKIK